MLNCLRKAYNILRLLDGYFISSWFMISWNEKRNRPDAGSVEEIVEGSVSVKKDLRIWAVILGMIAAGLLITRLNQGYVSRQRAAYFVSEAASVPSLQETVQDQEEEADETVFARARSGESVLEEQEAAAAAPAAAAMPEEDVSEEEETSGETKEAEGSEPLLTAGISQEALPETRSRTAEADQETMEAEEAAAAGQEENSDYHQELARYEERLLQLDEQIAQMRNSETDNTVYNVKSLAQQELKIWEREMNGIYSLLLEALPEKDASQLREEQQEWMEESTQKARTAAGKSGGSSMESVEYTASLAGSYRERAYGLIQAYE